MQLKPLVQQLLAFALLPSARHRYPRIHLLRSLHIPSPLQPALPPRTSRQQTLATPDSTAAAAAAATRQRHATASPRPKQRPHLSRNHPTPRSCETTERKKEKREERREKREERREGSDRKRAISARTAGLSGVEATAASSTSSADSRSPLTRHLRVPSPIRLSMLVGLRHAWEGVQGKYVEKGGIREEGSERKKEEEAEGEEGREGGKKGGDRTGRTRRGEWQQRAQ
eukprot:637638-Rhodomonas_salina.1